MPGHQTVIMYSTVNSKLPGSALSVPPVSVESTRSDSRSQEVSQVSPVTTAGGRAPRPASASALGLDGLRDALLARVSAATTLAWSRQDAELDAEIAALEAAGYYDEPPPEAELYGLAPDPAAGPPDGAEAWLAGLP